jgi:RNA polymerase sigma-70 factor (ECF subfamily)
LKGLDAEQERKLVEAAQIDPARFLEIYDRHFHRIYAYVVRRTWSRAEAEDVTSAVFVRALANIHSFEWRGWPFSAWLYRIAANELSDRRARSAREQAEPAPMAEEITDDVEQRVLLYELVERLPDAQRRVVELRFGEDKTIEDVATVLGKSAGAVKQLQRRALEALRAALGGRR